MNEIYPWQQLQWQQITQAIKINRLPHALLLTGAKGLGKFSFAFNLSYKLLCDSSKECQRLLQAETHPDLFIIGLSEKSKVIKVDDLQLILNQSKLTPMLAKQKVVIIKNAELMTMQSANSFLKILEEPAGNTTFILLSNLEKSLLATIKSRCQTIIFQEPTVDELTIWIQTNNQQNIDNNEIKILSNMANFAPLLIKDYLNNKSKQLYVEILEQIYSVQKTNIFTISMSWSKLDYLTIIIWWQSLIFELLKQRKIPNYSIQIPIINKIINANSEQLLRFYDKLLATKIALQNTANVRLVLDDLLLSWLKIK